MKMSKKNLIATAIIVALSTGLSVSGMTPAFAADTPTKSTAAPAGQTAANDKQEKEFIKVSDDALASMRAVVATRLAIFNGQPDKAKTLINEAGTRVAATLKDADKYAVATDEPTTDDMYVPFDANLTVAEGFVPTPEKMKHIAKANEHLHKGERQKALEVLKLGEVDVAVTAKMVPVKLAKKQIEEATKLIGEGKYYEANLALKAIDDAIVVDTFAVDSVPKVKTKQ
jgi:hypothetical protein